MKTIELDGNIFEVDIEKTKKYYSSNSLCDCKFCLRFNSEVKNRYPVLTDFLSRFGIDIERPDETEPADLDNEMLYIMAGYSVCGKILNLAKEKIYVTDNKPMAITFGTGYEFPNEQTGEYFCLTVYDISFPKEEK